MAGAASPETTRTHCLLSGPPVPRPSSCRVPPGMSFGRGDYPLARRQRRNDRQLTAAPLIALGCRCSPATPIAKRHANQLAQRADAAHGPTMACSAVQRMRFETTELRVAFESMSNLIIQPSGLMGSTTAVGRPAVGPARRPHQEHRARSQSAESWRVQV